MTYTAGDYERALADWDADQFGHRGPVEAALRMATRVMRPGFIKAALKDQHRGEGNLVTGEMIEQTLRKALVE